MHRFKIHPVRLRRPPLNDGNYFAITSKKYQIFLDSFSIATSFSSWGVFNKLSALAEIILIPSILKIGFDVHL